MAIPEAIILGGSVCGVESYKIVLLGGTSYSLVRTLLLYDVLFSNNAQRQGQTD